MERSNVLPLVLPTKDTIGICKANNVTAASAPPLLYTLFCRILSQEATAVAIASDGSVIVAGWTWGEYFEENAGLNNTGEWSIGFTRIYVCACAGR